MAQNGEIDAATLRLMLALDLLEAAVERRESADRDGAAVETQLHMLGADRARLASDLDAAAARAQALEAANRAAVARIDNAAKAVRAVLDRNDR